jgi:hypothetical protein
MTKGTRITLTKRESESATGKRLIETILNVCQDERIDKHEIEAMHSFLCSDGSGLAAIPFLRAICRDVLADGTIDDAELHRLKLAFSRVVPKDVRSTVSAHLERIGLPSVDDADETAIPSWTLDAATERQIHYILDLGGHVAPQMTKGDASELIDQLLERRPATPRQVMLLRFFNRMDLAHACKDEVSMWIDECFVADERHERAWDRFKRATNHDPRGRDPAVVPIGAYLNYMDPRSLDGNSTTGCVVLLLGSLALLGGLIIWLR